MLPVFQQLPAWADPWPGRAVLHDVPEAAYHGTKSLISKSALDIFARSPMHYHYSLTAAEREETDALRIGGAFHVLTLEPDLFRRKVAISPDFGSLRSARNREARDAWEAEEARGRIVLSPEELEQITAMANAVRTHPAARLLFRDGSPEVTAIWTDPETGLRCKSRADWLSAMNGVFVDLKSALTASPGAWRRAAADHRYHVQDAFYSRAFEENDIHIQHFVFVVVEKEPPYAVACYQLDETAKLKGEELYMGELRRLQQCIANDTWPGYGDRVMDLSLPAWATVTESV